MNKALAVFINLNSNMKLKQIFLMEKHYPTSLTEM